MAKNPAEPPQKCQTIPLWPDCGKILGYGRRRTYAEAKRGGIKILPVTTKTGRRMVSKAWLKKFLEC